MCSCGKKQRATTDNILYMNISAGLTSLDPAFARNEANCWMIGQVFSGLIELDTLMRLKPGLAYRWTIDSSGCVYRFYLRKDVFFHNDSAFGKKNNYTRRVTAQDCAYSLSRICNPEVASPGAWLFKDKVVGAQAFAEKKAERVAGFIVENDSIFQIRLERPYVPFLQLLTMPYTYIVPQEVVKKHGKNFGQHPIGTGPFCFKTWVEGQALILTKNTNYYEKGYPLLQAIHVRTINNKITAFNALLEGTLDYIENLDPVVKNEVLNTTGQLKPHYAQNIYLQTAPQLTTEYIGINLRKSNLVTQNINLRKALHFAIDKQQLCKYLLKNTATPAYGGIIPVGLEGNINTQPQYNPDSAQYYIAKVKEKIPDLALTLTTSPNYTQLAEFLQRSFSMVGLTLKLQTYEGATLKELVNAGELELWRASWVADYPDGENFLSLFYSPNLVPNGPNTTGYHSAYFDSLYQASLNVTNIKRKISYYQVLEQNIVTQVPIIPLYYYQTVRLVNKRIKYLPICPANLVLPLKFVKKYKS